MRGGTRFPHSQFIWLRTDHFGCGCCDPLVFHRAVWAPTGELRCGVVETGVVAPFGCTGHPSVTGG